MTIKSIAYKPEDATEHAVGYLRVLLERATLIAGYGIEGDSKGGNPNRHLNVMDDVTLAELAAEGYPASRSLGQNITLSGIDLRTLPMGTQLRLGPESVIELLKLRTGCEQLTALDGRMPDAVQGRIGVMCQVVQGGPIAVGDAVQVLGEAVRK